MTAELITPTNYLIAVLTLVFSSGAVMFFSKELFVSMVLHRRMGFRWRRAINFNLVVMVVVSALLMAAASAFIVKATVLEYQSVCRTK